MPERSIIDEATITQGLPLLLLAYSPSLLMMYFKNLLGDIKLKFSRRVMENIRGYQNLQEWELLGPEIFSTSENTGIKRQFPSKHNISKRIQKAV